MINDHKRTVMYYIRPSAVLPDMHLSLPRHIALCGGGSWGCRQWPTRALELERALKPLGRAGIAGGPLVN